MTINQAAATRAAQLTAASLPGVPEAGNVAARPKAKASRLLGLDFVKGALVLIMVLYHWMNYFIGLDSEVYNYLRFLTPSFIFLAGFLIAQVYVPRYAAGDRHIPSRLIRRGLKLMAIVLSLNAVAKALGTGMVSVRMSGQPLSNLLFAFLTGSSPVAFSVLVPIAYLLMLAAGLLVVSRRFRGIFHLASILMVTVALICERIGFENGYLQILSAGMIGLSAGHISIDRITRLVRRPLTMLAAYAVYLWALQKWNIVYLMQIAAVCVNLAVLYGIGTTAVTGQFLGRVVVRLGEYSLFAYIVQIMVLQVMRRLLHTYGAGPVGDYMAIFGCMVCTALSVEILDRGKRRIPVVNRVYAAVFV